MAGEWRVRVSLPKGSRAVEDSPWAAAMRALPSRVSDDIKVSQAPARLFLYAASAGAAARAEQVVRDVLARAGPRGGPDLGLKGAGGAPGCA